MEGRGSDHREAHNIYGLVRASSEGAYAEVLYWLTINRELISLSELKEDIVFPQFKQQLPETLNSLKKKSLGKNISRK